MGDLPIFENLWLVPGLLVLAGLFVGFLLYAWRRKALIAAEARKMESYRLDPDEELKTLGIVGVRTLEETAPSQNANERVRREHSGSESEATEQPIAGPIASIVDELMAEDEPQTASGAPVPRFSPRRTVAPVDNAESVSMGRHPGTYLDQGSPLWKSSDAEANPDAVAFLLESLWAAIHAQSIALLRFDGESSAYAVDALVSERVTRQIDLFPSGGNMLNLVADDTSIAILEPDAFGALRYHANPMISVGHAIAIAVHGARERVLLVADAERSGDAFDNKSLERFGDYADFLARLLPTRVRPSHPGETDQPPFSTVKPTPSQKTRESLESAIAGTISTVDAISKDGADVPEPLQIGESSRREKPPKEREFTFDVDAATNDEEPRIAAPEFKPANRRNGSSQKRSAIIAEEMAAARATEEPLAFALVVPRNAVDLAARGPTAVARAESELLNRLRYVPGSARVEMFGELVVGVFCHAGPAFVEAWVERVEASGSAVQIGIAMLRARHRTPESFRADAQAALREAYERKEDCVIVD